VNGVDNPPIVSSVDILSLSCVAGKRITPMAKESRVAPPLVAPEPIDFRTNEIEGTIAEKSRSRGILLCLSSSSDGHKVDPKELNDISK
jgi:hypothetical protein